MDRSGHWISDTKRAAIYAANNFICAYCGKACTKSSKRGNRAGVTLDHVLAREIGGTNAATNLVVAHRRCNSAKGTMSLKGFLAYLSAKGVDVSQVAKRVQGQLDRGMKIEHKFGNRAGKPQFRKAA